MESARNENQIFRVFFQKLIILAFSPIIIFTASLIFWQLWFKIKTFRTERTIEIENLDDSGV